MLFTQEPKRHPTRRRIATVVLAPIVALGGWALIRLAGIDLTVSVDPGTVRAGDVFAAALVAALGAWGVVLLLERYTRSPRRWWPFIGSTALALSVIGPRRPPSPSMRRSGSVTSRAPTSPTERAPRPSSAFT
jgi:hypothetical protein